MRRYHHLGVFASAFVVVTSRCLLEIQLNDFGFDLQIVLVGFQVQQMKKTLLRPLDFIRQKRVLYDFRCISKNIILYDAADLAILLTTSIGNTAVFVNIVLFE